MLNQMRTLAGSYVAKLLLILLILSFVIWGVGDMLRGPGAGSAVAKIGGEKITVHEYQRMLRSEMERIRRSLGDQYTPELLKGMNIPTMVLGRMINQRLLALDSKDLGLIPGDSDIARRIRLNPSFADQSGNFSKERFIAILRAMGKTEKAYIEEMRSELGGNMIMDSISGAAHITDTELETVYLALEEQRTATLYTLSPSSISVGTPSAAELETYYNEHSENYSLPERRAFSYMVISQDQIRKNTKVSDDELQAAYKERIEEFKQSERRVVEQMLFSDEAKANAALAQVKGGKNFIQVAKQSDIQNKTNISLGAIESGRMMESAEAVVFSLPENGVTDVIKSPFGFHIFHVSKIHPPATATFAEVKERLQKDLLQGKFEEEVNSFTNKLQDMLASGISFSEAAKELNLTVKTTEAVTVGGENAQGKKSSSLPDLDKFLETGFKTEEKTDSPLVASKDGKYYIVHTDSVAAQRVRPLDEIKERVKASWEKLERSKKLAAIAKEVEKDFASAASRKAAVGKYNLTASSMGPFKQSKIQSGNVQLPGDMSADLFSKAKGGSTAAYAIGDSYALAVVDSIIPANKKIAEIKDDAEFVQVRKTLEQQQADEMIDQYMRYLANRYSVRVNEEMLATLTQNADQ